MLSRKVASIGVMSVERARAVKTLPVRIRHLKAGDDVLRLGEPSGSCCLLLDGFMHRYKVLANGRRQILAWYAAGDIPDFCSLFISPPTTTLPL